MDIDELIRAELTTQAEAAPDPRDVLAGVPARARARRHRRLTLTAATAAAVVLAVAVPYAVLDREPTVLVASEPRQSVALDWEPGWSPPELTETNREVRPGLVSGRFTDYAHNRTQGVDWQVGNDNMGLSTITKRTPVQVGSYRGFWDDGLDDGMARLYFEVEPGLYAFVGVTDWTPDPRAVALRVGASIHRDGDRAVDLPVRFDQVPAGMSRASGVNAGSTGSAEAWSVVWAFSRQDGRGIGVTAFRGTQARFANPGVGDLGEEESRTPVTVGGRTASWVVYRSESIRVGPGSQVPVRTKDNTIRVLEVPLDGGVTVRLMPTAARGESPAVPDADVLQMAAGAVQLPVDYGWMGR